MSDSVQRQALERIIPRHLAPLSLAALRILDEVAVALLVHEREHGAIDLAALHRTGAGLDVGDPIGAAIHAIGTGLVQQDREREELHEAARREMVGEITEAG